MPNLPTAPTSLPPHLYFAVYPDYTVPPWLACRVKLDRDGEGAAVELNQGLPPRQQLQALAWSANALTEQLTGDGQRFATGSLRYNEFVLVLPLDQVGDLTWRDNILTCADCGEDFNPNYSPHLDRCAGCAERHDVENGDDR